MNTPLRKILINPHVATSAATFAVVLLVNAFGVPAEKANTIVASLVGLMLAIDAVLAGSSADTVPGVETKTTVTAVQVSAPDAAAVKETPKP